MSKKHEKQEQSLEEKEPGILPEIKKSEPSLIPEEEKSKVPDRIEKEMDKIPSQDDKSLTGDKPMYCTICNNQIEKYGRRKEDLKKPGWVFCPKHGWIKEGIHDKEMASEHPARFSIEEVPETHSEHEHLLEGKKSEVLSESTTPEALSMSEKGSEGDMNETTDKPMYCTICNNQIEKYGRRKEDFRKSGWVFCPKHGWIKEGIHDKEMASEHPARFSIEEVLEGYRDQEKSIQEKEPEIFPEIEIPETSQMIKEEDLETELSIERNPRPEDLSIGRKNVARKKSTAFGIIILAIFVTIFASSILGYFVWKNSSNRSLEIISLKAKALVQKENLTSQVQSQASTPPQEPVLVEKAPKEVKYPFSASPQEGLTQSEKAETTKKENVEPSKLQKPSQTLFTVQVGAFSDVSYAKSLKKRLDRKGYHTFITSSKSEKEGILHKVWTGKFNNREKAETLAAKITKTESIQTFVALRKNE